MFCISFFVQGCNDTIPSDGCQLLLRGKKWKDAIITLYLSYFVGFLERMGISLPGRAGFYLRQIRSLEF